MLDVRRLRVLQEVAEQGSFSAAADALSYTQSAVSQQIATLEREAGTTLIQRGPGGIRLTDAGRALLSHTEAVLAHLADAERELAAIADVRGGRVRMASFPTAGATLVTRAVSVFHDRHPDVELTLSEAEPEESLPRLRRGDFELALVYDYGQGVPGGGPSDGTELVHLLDDPMLMALPSDHRLAARKSIQLDELADEPWVGGVREGRYCNDCAEMLVRTCGAAGFEPRLAFESDDHTVQLGLVATGMGVALLPQLGLFAIPPGVTVRPVARARPKREVLAAVPARGYRSPATEAMLDVLRQVSDEFKAGVAYGAAQSALTGSLARPLPRPLP
jgi:DNA-binding transcriptional LysR family regulator